MEGFKAPKGLDIHSTNLSDSWKKFRQSFEIYLKATEKNEVESEIKVAILLNLIGEDALGLYNTFNLDEDDSKSFEKVLDAFEKYCCPKKNVVYERFVFNKRSQLKNESFDKFLTELRKLVATCDYGSLHDEMLRDRIVIGISDASLQERLLRIEDLELQTTINACRAAELSKNQGRCLQDKIVAQGVKATSLSEPSSSQLKSKCHRCQKTHGNGQCPAFGQRCTRCGKLNHFAVSCKVKLAANASTGNASGRSRATYRGRQSPEPPDVWTALGEVLPKVIQGYFAPHN